MLRILIIDDDQGFCKALADILSAEKYEPVPVHDAQTALNSLQENSFDLVLLDMRLGPTSGTEILEKIKKIDDNLPVIILTGYGDIKDAVKSIKSGAFDYLTKPVDNDELLLHIKRASQIQELRNEVEILREQLERGLKEEADVVYKSIPMKDVIEEVKKVSPTDLSVIIQGESGSGKEVLARLIHRNSLRRSRPFIAVDCGTIPESLVESELFGYEKGAFTGADRRKIGQFELAQGGTIFLDEIANLPLAIQAKFLRTIQEKEINRLGGKKGIKIDVRILIASNVPLADAVKRGEFRDDLFHRLNQFSINIPPLRARHDDIKELCSIFLKEANSKLHKEVFSISEEALDLFLGYHWPGNVRELRNALFRACLLAGQEILPEHLPDDLQEARPIPRKKKGLRDIAKSVAEPAEKEAILSALKKSRGKKGRAAEVLGISRRSLYNKMKRFGLL